VVDGGWYPYEYQPRAAFVDSYELNTSIGPVGPTLTRASEWAF
jgi:hypothetical protein